MIANCGFNMPDDDFFLDDAIRKYLKEKDRKEKEESEKKDQ